MKKVFILISFAICAVFFSFKNLVFAENNYELTVVNDGFYKTYNISGEICKKDFPVVPYDQYNDEYKVEYLPTVMKTVNGKIKDQPAGGIRIDGYINVDTSGGSSDSVSVSLSHPDFPYVSLNYTLGKYAGTSVSGGSIRVPDKDKYYHAYAEKTYKIKAYIVYTRPKRSNKPWTVYTRNSSSELFREYYYVKEV